MYNKLIITIIVVNLENEMALNVKSKIECGYKQCPPTREGALNVHLIPHSHMDAGWVKTFDEYYHGTRTVVSTANVQLIYHSVLSELLHDRRRKFTFSETAYFWRWWKEQRPATRSTFRTLVQEGRIEFAGGGWVQNDEATLDYMQIIDQFTWGLRKLNDTLGPCGKPKAAWQIDTYGHTREQASLLAQMGYDGLFIGRVDHKQREAMIEEDRMEFMWRGSDVLGKMSDIMSHTLFNLYNAPDGFCFDFLCSDEPIVDDPDSLVYNAEKRVAEFISQVERQAKYYDHDNILVAMGGDFTYQSAGNWFMNMDKLINHVNTHRANISDVNIFYSTPSCYLKAIYLYGRRDKAIYTERGDHVPYSSDAGTYWTGYYTSRPSLKYFARRAHTFLQVVKQLTVIARMGDSFELHLLRHAANLVLHHDAITGTSQQHVTNDFIRTLSEAIDACTKKVSTLLSYLTPTWGGSRRSKNNQQFTVCHQLNMTQCKFTESPEAMLLLVYNPSSVKTYHHVRIPAMVLHYTIRDYNDEEVEYQLMPLPAAVINLPGRSSTAIQELCFEAENIPPLGFTAYYISPVRDQLEENEFAKKVKQANKVVEPDQEITPNISNEYLKVAVNKETGLLESIQHVDGVKVELSQNFHYYSQTQQAFQSGAYSFRPDRNRPVPVTEKVSYNTIRGNIVKEIRQRFTDWITQTIRLYRGEEFVELEWIIGPVPIGADLGKEVVSLFKTNVTNSGQFHTDSNGRQMVQRTCWNETAGDHQKRPVSSCYYPVTSRLCVLSTNASTPVGVCVLTDRTQGGTAYEEGEIELMVHRRLLTDDGFGLEESLNEEAFGVGLVVKGRHRIYFGNFKQDIDDLTFSERMAHASRRWQMEPWLFFTPGEKVTRRKWQNIRTKRYTALKVHGLPRNVQVLTLEPWKSGSVLLRLENTLDRNGKGSVKSENPDVPSSPSHATVRLRQLFLQLRIRRVRETTLGANQWLDDARQMDWSTRYVYSGADDDILPEDQALFTDDSKADKELAKDAAPYSDEEPAYARRKAPRKRIDQKPNRPKTKTVYEEAERKKRYANENVMDNVINGTFNDKFNEQVNQTNEGTDKSIQYQTVKTDFMNETSSLSEDLFKLLKAVTKHPQGVRKTEQRYLNSKGNVWSKPTKFFVDFDNDSEEMTSDEDFTSNSSKKVERKWKARPDPITTDSDDGITKSIYEMYYKTKPRQMPFRPLIRSSEEVTEEPQAGRRYSLTSTRLSISFHSSGVVQSKTEMQGYRNKKPERILAIDYKSTEDTRDTEESRSIEEVRKRFRKRKNKGKILKVDMPFFLTSEGRDFGMKKRGYEESRRGYVEESGEMRTKQEEKGSEIDALPMKERKAKRIDEHEVESPFDVDDEKETERYDEPASESRMENRRKRASRLDEMDAPTSEQTPDEPDYVVTLRPTQIRTFVIWFENNKKPYAV